MSRSSERPDRPEEWSDGWVIRFPESGNVSTRREGEWIFVAVVIDEVRRMIDDAVEWLLEYGVAEVLAAPSPLFGELNPLPSLDPPLHNPLHTHVYRCSTPDATPRCDCGVRDPSHALDAVGHTHSPRPGNAFATLRAHVAVATAAHPGAICSCGHPLGDDADPVALTDAHLTHVALELSRTGELLDRASDLDPTNEGA